MSDLYADFRETRSEYPEDEKPFNPKAPPPVDNHPKAGPVFKRDLPDYQVVQRLTEKLHHDRLIHSCLTCDHFQEHVDPEETLPHMPLDPAETCKLYHARPPARVIAYGCPSWTDGLPF